MVFHLSREMLPGTSEIKPRSWGHRGTTTATGHISHTPVFLPGHNYGKGKSIDQDKLEKSLETLFIYIGDTKIALPNKARANSQATAIQALNSPL